MLRRLPAPSATQAGSELRYYLQNGQIFKATRKAILPPGTVAPAVMEETMVIPAEESSSLLVRVSRLALETDAATVAKDYATLLGVSPK